MEPDFEYIPARIELTALIAEKSRDQVINSIINPKHATRTSYNWETMPSEEVFSMINYSRTISLGQLSDVVAFLQNRISQR